CHGPHRRQPGHSALRAAGPQFRRQCNAEVLRLAMSMTATANGQMSGKSDGSSALSWNHRALRLPVAVSLALHASVFAGALFWWQANGTPAPKGLPEGMSVTFVRLS